MNNIFENYSGYTLLETLSVILIISIISTYIISNGIDFNHNIRAEVEVAKSHFRYIQYVALINDVDKYEVDFEADSYTLLKNGDSVFLPNEISGTHTLPPDWKIEIFPNTATGSISFANWGSPDITYKITIRDSDGNSEQFEIIKNTGAIL